MASITPHSTVSVESPAPKEESKGSTSTTTGGLRNHVVVDVVLRVTLFVTAFVALILVLTSKQTKIIPVAPGLAMPITAKFYQTPALIFFVVALSVACLYSLITGGLSVLALVKPKESSTKLILQFVILDVVLLGIMASATGAVGAVGYIAYIGNSHTRWNKVCNIYNTFCGHIAGAISLSVFPCLALMMLVWLTISVLSKKIGRS